MVEKEISQCMACTVTVKIHPQEPLKPTELPSEPWDKLATDFYGPLTTGQHLLVMQRLYSRYPVAEIATSTLSEAMIQAMDKVLSLAFLQKSPVTMGHPMTAETQKQRMKEYADNWPNAKLSDIKVGDRVLCHQQKVNKWQCHTTMK